MCHTINILSLLCDTIKCSFGSVGFILEDLALPKE